MSVQPISVEALQVNIGVNIGRLKESLNYATIL